MVRKRRKGIYILPNLFTLAALFGGFFAIVMGGIWFAAVYNSHHYVLDVLAGIVCAITGIYLFQWIIQRSETAQRFIQMFVRAIE